MKTTLLDEGLTLMMVGMGTVFVFLTLLVLAMVLLSFLAQRFLPVPDSTGISKQEVAAISAAITQHRKDHSTP